MSSNTYSLPTLAAPVTDKVTLTSLRTPGDIENRTHVISVFLTLFKGTFANDKEAVELSLDLLVLCFPDLAAVIKGATSVNVRNVEVSRADLEGFLTIGPATGNSDLSIPIPNPPDLNASAITEVSAVYSAASMILFATGRQVREASGTGAAVNRPKALINEFSISETNQELFPGKLYGPAIQSLERIYNAFNIYSELRALITKYFLAAMTQRTHYPTHMRPFITNFQMMGNAGMTHVGAIMKLVQGHPWIVRVPALEPYFRTFCADLKKLEQIPEKIRPYHRLLSSPTDFLFLTSSLRPLIAVAGSFLADVEKTFSGYVYNEAQYQDLVREVKSRAPMYSSKDKLDDLAASLGLESIPDLPPISAPSGQAMPSI